MRIGQEIRTNVDSLGKRLEDAASADELLQNASSKNSSAAASVRRAEIQSIVTDIKQLISDIDESVPIFTLWVSAIGGIQMQPPSGFSPSRLLQASMLVNVGDMQYILDPSKPMQIGPDFTLSLYMPFRAHATTEDPGEPYGVEDGQRKPLWQEVIHKARVRLRRVPVNDDCSGTNGLSNGVPHVNYAYELHIVEDLDDDRVHTVEDGHVQPSSYDGVPLAGIREAIPVHQLSKIFYANVGRILNINNDDGSSSSPVLLLKRDVKAASPIKIESAGTNQMDQPKSRLLQDAGTSIESDSASSADGSQDEINRQIRQESQAAEETPSSTSANAQLQNRQAIPKTGSWKLPQDLDPEWIAVEVFEMDDDSNTDTTDEDREPTPEEGEEPSNAPASIDFRAPKLASRPSADSNLVTQLNRMSMASSISRPSSRDSGALVPDPDADDDLLERSPFGAIQTSLSLLEMLLRLASLQEFEQNTHLAIPDHVLRYYLDEQGSRVDA